VTSLQDKIAGGILGLLIGDALGVPYEFHSSMDIPPLNEIELEPPAYFRRSHDTVAPGVWSDDGAQALTLLASLNNCGKLDLEDFGRRLINWYEWGYMAVDNYVYDVGVQTSNAIGRLSAGIPPTESGPASETANGNGSLMRVLPLALWHLGSDEELVDDAHQQSIVTHGHMRSQVCCALYCLWARFILEESNDPWDDAVSRLREIYGPETTAREELEWSIRPDDNVEVQGSGYVVDCLRSARWALNAGDYEQVVKAAISLGRDTDTTACVAGGIAGLRDGLEAIPERWRLQLKGAELYEPELEQLISRRVTIS